jgi:predicted DNA binding protein
MNMQKAIIEMNPKFALKFWPEKIFDHLEHIEGRALLRLDFEKGIKIGIIDIKMRDETPLEELQMPNQLTILNVLERKNNTYTCLIRVKYEKKLLNLSELQPLKILMTENIIFDLPFLVSRDKIMFTIVTDSKQLRKILKVFKPLGLLKNVSFHKPAFSEHNILSCLTERQKEVIIAAKKNGYYSVPREITSEELSKKLGISKATTVEHLRKAEHRIISHIMAGY